MPLWPANVNGPFQNKLVLEVQKLCFASVTINKALHVVLNANSAATASCKLWNGFNKDRSDFFFLNLFIYIYMNIFIILRFISCCSRQLENCHLKNWNIFHALKSNFPKSILDWDTLSPMGLLCTENIWK